MRKRFVGVVALSVCITIMALQGPVFAEENGEEEEECIWSQGHWRNNDAWPLDAMDLGAHSYDEAALRNLYDTPPKGDGSMQLAHQLIATTLNRASGATDLEVDGNGTHISHVIAAAHDLIGTNTLPAGAKGPAGAPWRELAATFDEYNNRVYGMECSEGEEDDRPLVDVGVMTDSNLGDQPRFTPEDPALVPAGGAREVWYHVMVESYGPETATDVTLTAMLPDVSNNWFFFFGIGATWCTITDNLLSCDFGDLDPGAMRSIDLHVSLLHASDCPTVEAGLSATFETATSANDVNPANDAATHTIHVECA